MLILTKCSKAVFPYYVNSNKMNNTLFRLLTWGLWESCIDIGNNSEYCSGWTCIYKEKCPPSSSEQKCTTRPKSVLKYFLLFTNKEGVLGNSVFKPYKWFLRRRNRLYFTSLHWWLSYCTPVGVFKKVSFNTR